MNDLATKLAVLGFAPVEIEPLAGDASTRRFFRVRLASGEPVVACHYPPTGEAQAARDFRVQCWGWEQGLPIPQPLGWAGAVVVSRDLGSEDLERGLRRQGDGVVEPALRALARFQRCPWQAAPTPPFDGALFRRELEVFEEFALGGRGSAGSAVTAFLDGLAGRLERHHFRLVHRDFHANNLFLVEGQVWATDFQDMRGGPDTYDAVSLLRERAGAELVADEPHWQRVAANLLNWEEGWQQRLLECAAQRGLKVIGTFLRLVAGGRNSYLRWLAPVQEKTRAALRGLGAPKALVEVLAHPLPRRGL